MNRTGQNTNDSIEFLEISDQLSEQVSDDADRVEREYQEFYQWMRERGNDHIKENGLSKSNTDNYFRRVDQLHRVALGSFDSDEVMLTPDQADELMLMLARDEITKQNGGTYAKTSKRKFLDAVKKYLEWRYYEGELEFEWTPRIKFSDGSHTQAAEFTYEEIGRLLEEAESHGKLPSYYETSAEERERINGLVAQRLGKPKETINRDDWRRADQSATIACLGRIRLRSHAERGDESQSQLV